MQSTQIKPSRLELTVLAVERTPAWSLRLGAHPGGLGKPRPEITLLLLFILIIELRAEASQVRHYPSVNVCD